MTIGLFVLPLPIVATIVLLRIPKAKPRFPVFATGFGLPLLYVAFLNRSGPGEVCRLVDGGYQCGDQLHPLPWLAAGLVLTIAGVVLHARRA